MFRPLPRVAYGGRVRCNAAVGLVSLRAHHFTGFHRASSSDEHIGHPILGVGFGTASRMEKQMADGSTTTWKGGTEHWIRKGEVKLFLWNKKPAAGVPRRGTVFFVHGSSMASQPTFDLFVPGRADSSVMDWFAARGFDTWTMDNEGYGRSDKSRPQNNDISNGADDLAAGTEYVIKPSGAKKSHMYGISSGALKAALFAQRHPDRVDRLALDAFVWTGEGSPTLAERKKKLPQFQAVHRRPIDRAFVHSIFNRDHPGTADQATIEAFADAI